MAILTTKIPNFINKAQTRLRELGTLLLGEFDSQGYQSEGSEDLSLKIYETRNFIDLLLTSDFGGMTNKEINDYIDFFTGWLQLRKVNAVNYTNYQMPISTPVLITNPALYALAADLQAEANTRSSSDSGLNQRVTALENAAFEPADVFEPGFFDNYVATYTVVFDDDSRLHTHGNKTQLDLITSQMLTDLGTLPAHFASLNSASALHVTTAERALWNAMTTPVQLAAALSNYSQTGHTHTISQILNLQNVINQINLDIAAMAGDDGADGREVELRLNGDDLEYRYTGDDVWVNLGNVRGPEGPEFTIDVKAEDSQRFNSVYDNEDSNFSFLATDTGYMYFREPGGGSATVPGGWSIPFKFTGENGWSPMLGLFEVSPGRVVQELIDWIGGDGDKPVLDPGPNPSLPVRWFVGANGFVLDQSLAVNVKGVPGVGRGPVIGATGSLAGRAAHDGKAEGFIYMRTDVTPQTIYIKNSDASGDWSVEYPWQGPPGSAGSVSLIDDEVDSSGVIIVLNLNNYGSVTFTSPSVIDEAKEWQLLNDENVFTYRHFFNISGGLWPQTMPDATVMSDGRYDLTTRVWTPTETGWYVASAFWTGTFWVTEMQGPINAPAILETDDGDTLTTDDGDELISDG